MDPGFFKLARLPGPVGKTGTSQAIVRRLVNVAAEVIVVSRVAPFGYLAQRRTRSSYDVDISSDRFRQELLEALLLVRMSDVDMIG